jgi:hypothetical protein
MLASETVTKTMIRPTESLGVSYGLWAAGKDEAVAYADFRNAFKPAAIDFGPASEFGSESFYLLPSRTLWLGLRCVRL